MIRSGADLIVQRKNRIPHKVFFCQNPTEVLYADSRSKRNVSNITIDVALVLPSFCRWRNECGPCSWGLSVAQEVADRGPYPGFRSGRANTKRGPNIRGVGARGPKVPPSKTKKSPDLVRYFFSRGPFTFSHFTEAIGVEYLH